MIHRSGQIGMREGDSAERTIAKRIAGSGLAIQSEEETGLRINESVTKTVEHDPGDVALSLIRNPVSSSDWMRSEEHTSELQSHHDLVCRLLLEKKKKKK